MVSDEQRKMMSHAMKEQMAEGRIPFEKYTGWSKLSKDNDYMKKCHEEIFGEEK